MSRGPRIILRRVSVTCAHCGKEYNLMPSEWRKKTKRNTSGKMFCSKRCSDNHKRIKMLEKRMAAIDAQIGQQEKRKAELRRQMVEAMKK